MLNEAFFLKAHQGFHHLFNGMFAIASVDVEQINIVRSQATKAFFELATKISRFVTENAFFGLWIGSNPRFGCDKEFFASTWMGL